MMNPRAEGREMVKKERRHDGPEGVHLEPASPPSPVKPTPAELASPLRPEMPTSSLMNFLRMIQDRLAVGKAGGESAWIEIKEGCEMPDPGERVFVYVLDDNSNCGGDRLWEPDTWTYQLAHQYWDGRHENLRVTHWQRITPPYVAPKLKEGGVDGLF